jgi:hypothetical protein
MNDLQQLLEKYRKYAMIHHQVVLGDKVSVKKGNRAANQLIRIAEQINGEFANGAEAFSALLNEREYKIDCWAAFHLIERIKSNEQQQQKALAVIESYVCSE